MKTQDEVLIAGAAALARELHEGELYKSNGQPYFEEHLVPVAKLVEAAGLSARAVAAALLQIWARNFNFGLVNRFASRQMSGGIQPRPKYYIHGFWYYESELTRRVSSMGQRIQPLYG